MMPARVFPPDLLAIATLFVEARGESYRGQVCVGEVIRERMRRRLHSDGTVAGTVFARRQFSGWEDDNRRALGSVQFEDPAWRSCSRAWAESETSNWTKAATHYLNPVLVLAREGRLPSWACDPHDITTLAEALVTCREGGHAFLRL
jgi:spore germination cell wall hydrolase CwlJ-like protein